MLKDLIRELRTPRHKCDIENQDPRLSKIPTPLDLIKAQLAEKAIDYKAELETEYPSSELYVGLRAVFARKGTGTDRIIGYRIIARGLFAELVPKRTTLYQQVLVGNV